VHTIAIGCPMEDEKLVRVSIAVSNSKSSLISPRSSQFVTNPCGTMDPSQLNVPYDISVTFQMRK
jgi:hypothetical protein